MKAEIYLIGVGMGNPATLTQEAMAAIQSSDLLIGARRMLAPFAGLPCEKRALVFSREIADEIYRWPGRQVSVLFSGDPGFYSGASGLYPLLEDFSVHTLPGISSVNYFCAKLHTTWQDVFLLSAHGRDCNPVGEIQRHRKTFLLTGGKTRVEDLCRALTERGLGKLTVHAGSELSYPEESIRSGTAEELSKERFPDLAVMLVENPTPITPDYCAPSLPDQAFLRSQGPNVPMTKEEVRQLALCKLRLCPEHTVWDVGAGTGSVSVECARAACAGQVFAVEKNPDAVALLQENKLKFSLPNLTIVPGPAPEVLEALPAPHRVFIGGSSGHLKEILDLAVRKNPSVRVVLTAITLETLQEALAYGLGHLEIVQLTAARGKAVGRYHMMTGLNPVYLISGEGRA